MRRVHLSLVFLFLTTAAHAADLENARAVQQGNRAVITYDLVADEPAPVSVKASDDGGRTWGVKLDHLSGDLGDAVAPGRGKTITWDALRDYPRGISIEALVFELSTSGGDFTDPVTGMEFVWVEGGCYRMGQSDGERRALIEEVGDENYKKWFADERPVHEVCVDGFYLGKTEVTIGQFRTFVAATGYRTEAEKGDGIYVWTGKKWKKKAGTSWKSPGFEQGEDHPVVGVSWNDAQAFAKWVSGKTGKAYRLPTEAQWEYAARAGTATSRFWGDDPDEACRYANVHDRTSKRVNGFSWRAHDCDDGYAVTAPVASFEPNGFGLYDMLGNVWEWTADWYASGYYGKSPRQDPGGPSSGSYRVIRGGSWYDLPRIVRSANRISVAPGRRLSYLGFRLVLSQ